MLFVDTNIIAALLLEHPSRESAKELFSADPDWRMPDWWQIEYANVIRNYHRAGQMDPSDALRALSNAENLFPPDNTHRTDLSDTLRIACEENISAYDARFISLARSFSQKLVTEDRRLRKGCPEDTVSLAEALEAG